MKISLLFWLYTEIGVSAVGGLPRIKIDKKGCFFLFISEFGHIVLQTQEHRLRSLSSIDSRLWSREWSRSWSDTSINLVTMVCCMAMAELDSHGSWGYFVIVISSFSMPG
jgi:hypothetical protein